MKRFLVGCLLTGGFCLLAATNAMARAVISDSDQFLLRQTDFRSGTSIADPELTTPPLTPYLFVDSFDSSLGTLTSVRIRYTLTARFNLTLTNNGPSPASARLRAVSNLSAFLIEGSNVGGEFVDPAFNGTDLEPGAFGVTAQTGNEQFVLASGQSTNYQRTVTAFRESIFTSASNPAVFNYFNGNGSPIQVGAEGKAFTTLTTSGNFSANQVTTDDGTFLVEYTYQPVPAPPAAVSLGIGGLVGLVGTGVKRFRRRTPAKK